jgi:hypothetical protein
MQPLSENKHDTEHAAQPVKFGHMESKRLSLQENRLLYSLSSLPCRKIQNLKLLQPCLYGYRQI